MSFEIPIQETFNDILRDIKEGLMQLRLKMSSRHVLIKDGLLPVLRGAAWLRATRFKNICFSVPHSGHGFCWSTWVSQESIAHILAGSLIKEQ
jgi:hypothetical protein